MKKTKTFQLGALLIGCAICFGTMRPAVAVAADANPIVFSAVARDADGFVKSNTTLQLDCRLVDRETRNTVYSETHTLSADAMGQLQIPLGDGTPTYGNFQEVDFSQPLDLLVFDGDQLLTDAPLTQVPSAAFAQTADHAQTANNALSAQSAQALDGIAFDDEAEPDQSTIWSSAKVSQMLGNQQQGVQSGQTAIAKERAERMAEDQRIWDSLKVRGNEQLSLETRIHDSLTMVWDSIHIIRNNLNTIDERVNDSLDIVWDSIHTIRSGLNAIDERVNDSLEVVWDSIDALKDEMRQQKDEIEQQLDGINYCLVNDAEKGIYYEPIPLYYPEDPEVVGLFANPILKVLRQDYPCYLFDYMEAAPYIEKSYRARVMTYNNSGDPYSPQEVYIPASTSDLEIYVDNFRMEEDAVYYTYDALVFDVEFYYLGEGITPKLYVTLIRE